MQLCCIQGSIHPHFVLVPWHTSFAPLLIPCYHTFVQNKRHVVACLNIEKKWIFSIFNNQITWTILCRFAGIAFASSAYSIIPCFIYLEWIWWYEWKSKHLNIFTFLATIVFSGPCFSVYKHLSLGISGIHKRTYFFKCMGKRLETYHTWILDNKHLQLLGLEFLPSFLSNPLVSHIFLWHRLSFGWDNILSCPPHSAHPPLKSHLLHWEEDRQHILEILSYAYHFIWFI